jgi:hypothetical protein
LEFFSTWLSLNAPTLPSFISTRDKLWDSQTKIDLIVTHLTPCEFVCYYESYRETRFDICLTVHHWHIWYKHQLDATITVY